MRFLLGIFIVFIFLWAVQSVWKREEKPQVQPLNTSAECVQGREVAFLPGGVIDTMNSPPKPGCPGHEDHRPGGIGTYKLGPYTFRIPRDYLWQAKYDEGSVEGLYLYVEYPSMKPAIEQFRKGGWDDELKVTLKFSDHCSDICYKVGCQSPSCWAYRVVYTRLHDPTPMRELNIAGAEMDEAVGLMRYTITQHKIDDAPPEHFLVYYSGDPEYPDEWYFCKIDNPSPSCRTL